MTRHLHREMSITRAEFLRLLPAALHGMPYHRTGNRIEAGENDKALVLDLEEGGDRVLGSLSLPVLHIELEASGFNAEEWAGLLRRFDLAYQRGGG